MALTDLVQKLRDKLHGSDRSEPAGSDAAVQPPVTETSGGTDPAETAQRQADAMASNVDDVTGIKGIGPSTAEKLNAAGVFTTRDLAAQDPADLLERIPGASVSQSTVKAWIDEAKRQTG